MGKDTIMKETSHRQEFLRQHINKRYSRALEFFYAAR